MADDLVQLVKHASGNWSVLVDGQEVIRDGYRVTAEFFSKKLEEVLPGVIEKKVREKLNEGMPPTPLTSDDIGRYYGKLRNVLSQYPMPWRFIVDVGEQGFYIRDGNDKVTDLLTSRDGQHWISESPAIAQILFLHIFHLEGLIRDMGEDGLTGAYKAGYEAGQRLRDMEVVGYKDEIERLKDEVRDYRQGRSWTGPEYVPGEYE